MDTKEFFYLLVSLAALTAIILPIVFDIWEPFKKYPKFDVILSPPSNPVDQITKLTVENIGDAQAKNAAIYVMSEESLEVNQILCPEGILSSKEPTITEVQFLKMSTNLKCTIEFTNSTRGLIYNVAITADDIDGVNFGKDPPLNLQKLAIINATEIPEKLREDIERLNQFTRFMRDTIIAVVLATIVVAFATKFFSVRQVEKKKKIEEAKLRRSLKERETEITNELNRTSDELDFLEHAITIQPEKKLPLNTIKQRNGLLDRISQLSNERDQLRGTILAKKDLHTLIGEFFNKWSNLEKQALSLGDKISGKRIRYRSIDAITNNLLQRGLVSKSLADKLQDLKRFRDDFVHGSLVSEHQLRTKIPLTENILEELMKIQIPIQYIVIIPSGTSVPGCEETDECFKPSKLTIRVGESVTWDNEDSAAHTITSGTPADGPDGNFDSSLIMSGNTFSFTFKEKGIYHYFSMVHPWQTGVIIVK